MKQPSLHLLFKAKSWKAPCHAWVLNSLMKTSNLPLRHRLLRSNMATWNYQISRLKKKLNNTLMLKLGKISWVKMEDRKASCLLPVETHACIRAHLSPNVKEKTQNAIRSTIAATRARDSWARYAVGKCLSRMSRDSMLRSTKNDYWQRGLNNLIEI